MNRIPLFLVYALYLLLLCEVFSFSAIEVLQDRMVFTSNYIPPENWTANGFHSDLGWVSNDRLTKSKTSVSCFGDSFTYGDEVSDKESWVSVINSLGISASNFGVGAYGVDQSYLRSYLQRENGSSVFLLSFTSENISRNLNVYRPFYHPGSKFYYTKPRFVSENGSVKLKANPIQQRKDINKLRSTDFLEQLGNHDRYFSGMDVPDDRFPHLRILFNRSFWEQLVDLSQGNENYFRRKKRLAAWKNADALKIQDHILSQFLLKSEKKGKLAIIMHLPEKGEIEDYLKNEKLPTAVIHTQKFCQDRGAICWFPILNPLLWQSEKVDEIFAPGGHYSVVGNKLIGEFVKISIDDLKKKKVWPTQ